MAYSNVVISRVIFFSFCLVVGKLNVGRGDCWWKSRLCMRIGQYAMTKSKLYAIDKESISVFAELWLFLVLLNIGVTNLIVFIEPLSPAISLINVSYSSLPDRGSYSQHRSTHDKLQTRERDRDAKYTLTIFLLDNVHVRHVPSLCSSLDLTMPPVTFEEWTIVIHGALYACSNRESREPSEKKSSPICARIGIIY